MIIKILSVIFIITMSGCGGSAKVKKISSIPTSHQVTFIESSSSAEVMVRATGIGRSISSAHKDASRAAIWFVLKGGDTPILQTAQEKKKFLKVEQEIYKNALSYITYDSGIKSKEKNSGKYYLSYVFKVNIALLKEFLVEKKIIKETQELANGLELPQISVISKSKNPDVIYAQTTLSEYLQDRDFDVTRLSNNGVDKIFLKIAQNISVDPMAAQMYANALSSGSDIYITVHISKSSRKIGVDYVKKASVALKAYYTATNKEIGATTGYSQERVVSSYSSVIAEATNDASNKLLNQIQRSWKREAKKGKAFKVIITTDMAREVKAPIYKAMKSSCKKVKPNKMINNILDYTLRCKNIENYQDLEMEISKNYNGPAEIFLDAAKGSFLIFKISNSQDDEIEIE